MLASLTVPLRKYARIYFGIEIDARLSFERVDIILLCIFNANSCKMVIFGYPGDIATENTTRAIWGTLSAIPNALW